MEGRPHPPDPHPLSRERNPGRLYLRLLGDLSLELGGRAGP
jgi:hypothetical protein